MKLEIEKCKVSAVEAMTGHELTERSEAILAADGARVGHATWASLTGLLIVRVHNPTRERGTHRLVAMARDPSLTFRVRIQSTGRDASGFHFDGLGSPSYGDPESGNPLAMVRANNCVAPRLVVDVGGSNNRGAVTGVER
ncbi:hypothetical protein [Rhodopirellula sp. P2]|uniref:hypothetical protein n=1 Tax=Rhodopirellula sp. P2 TaxID=2127060 RepID=UPI002367ECE3|nr:hypothetical protein [Rhodopirellula sp. P2]WDQ14963.1 hypothetical protein PSR62_15085 [Rhodopirellula sp. P2]WDQ14964.1 hypothetical protein PSR62_15090 [Rhodopirellula sp. P2]